VSQYQNGKSIWILLKQETVSGSGISRAICKSAPCSRQITTPAPHHSVFYRPGCPSCCPTNSVVYQTVKEKYREHKTIRKLTQLQLYQHCAVESEFEGASFAPPAAPVSSGFAFLQES